MIAENKQEFFEQLGRELEKLGVEDTSELMIDLEEHFAEGERRGIPESETCRELGSIAEIARSCLDLKSSAINSMVARDVERKKGVSLTKPGHSVPADPSLAPHAQTDAQTIPVEGAEDLPSYIPEHDSEEIYPNSAPNAAQVGANIGTSSTQNGEATDTASVNANTNASDTGAADNSANSSEGGAADGSANSTASPNAGTFEKVGKAVDAAMKKAGVAVNDAMKKAGEAVNDAKNKAGSAVGSFRPSDSYREHVNSGRHGGDLPPQYTKVKTGGSKFIDTSGLKPNPNAGRLFVEIMLDIFLWSWLIPVVFSLVIALGAATIALLAAAFSCLFGRYGFGKFKIITRALFTVGFINASSAVFCLACLAVKAPISFVKTIIERHIKAIYDI